MENKETIIRVTGLEKIFGDNAVLLAASLEALQSTFQRFVLFDTDFRH